MHIYYRHVKVLHVYFGTIIPHPFTSFNYKLCRVSMQNSSCKIIVLLLLVSVQSYNVTFCPIMPTSHTCPSLLTPNLLLNSHHVFRISKEHFSFKKWLWRCSPDSLKIVLLLLNIRLYFCGGIFLWIFMKILASHVFAFRYLDFQDINSDDNFTQC